jgi:sortase (surface protein transpeptidase)
MARDDKVRRGVVVLSLVVAGLAGCAGGGPAVEPAGRTAPATSGPAAPSATGAPAAGPTRTTEVIDFPIRSWRRLPPSPPVRLEIPAIGVSSALVRLGLDPDGSMQVPGDFQLAGWFTGGPQPGQLGPAVIAGHVDSRTGPAVFHRLRELRPGDQIRVVRADRLVVGFQVESLASYPKQSLPGDEVYGPTTAPSLRLITCAGTFDRARGSYRDNLVVSARIIGDADRGGRAEVDR